MAAELNILLLLPALHYSVFANLKTIAVVETTKLYFSNSFLVTCGIVDTVKCLIFPMLHYHSDQDNTSIKLRTGFFCHRAWLFLRFVYLFERQSTCVYVYERE